MLVISLIHLEHVTIVLDATTVKELVNPRKEIASKKKKSVYK